MAFDLWLLRKFYEAKPSCTKITGIFKQLLDDDGYLTLSKDRKAEKMCPRFKLRGEQR